MLTLTLCLMSVTVAETVFCVPIFSQYGRPGNIGSSDIQTSVASNWSATSGGESDATITSPREQSISSASTQGDRLPGDRKRKVAVRGHDAADASRSLTDGSTRTGSPGLNLAARRSARRNRGSRDLGRLTHCTGIRNAASRFAMARSSTSTVSRCSISEGPRYQGVPGLTLAMLSPASAD